MRIKTDYMGNDQLLPAYNAQIGVADAGYGSYNNYIFCEQNGIEKYMKFPMFKKETKDQKYHEDPFRAVNFRIDEQGVMRCPNDKASPFFETFSITCSSNKQSAEMACRVDIDTRFC